ncbi:MAG TPA: hypothetical protein VKB57_02680 [Acidimicrobiales bacterium]|nr:hypothetical protein [Acidimicrobiales bacterium]
MYPGPYAQPFAPQPVPSPAATARIGPSKWWFLVAGLIALAAIVVSILLVVLAFTDYESRISDFDRVRVPGTMQVQIDKPGGYTIYHEFLGADRFGGDSLGDPVDEDVFRLAPDVTVTSPGGVDLLLRRYDSSVTYTTSRHEGRALFSFRAPEAGRYEVKADGEEFPSSTIAVGRGLGRGLVAPVVASVVIGTLGVLAAVVLTIVIGVRRGHNRRALLAASGPGTPGAWPPGPAWGYPAAPPWAPQPQPWGPAPPPPPSWQQQPPPPGPRDADSPPPPPGT